MAEERFRPAANEALILPVPRAEPNPNLPGVAAQDTPRQRREFFFNGAWVLDEDALKIGSNNYADIQNLRYTNNGLRGVQGYSKINTTALSKTALRSAIQFLKRINGTVVSHVLVQAYNAGLTASSVYQNQTAIPNQGDFEATSLHDDASGAGLGRFALVPDGNVVYCNNKESLIWGSAEHRCAAFINYDDSGLTFRYDVTDRVQNTLTDAPNRITLSRDASNDIWILIGSTRPLQGIKFYVQNANTAASTSTVEEWDGTTWSAVSSFSDGTAAGGVTLAQTGTMSFDSTASSARVKVEDDYLLYFYRVKVGATGTPDATVRIYHCTVDAPMQSIVDIWDGIERTPILVEALGHDYTDEALVKSDLGADTPIAVMLGGMGPSASPMLIGFEERVTAIKFQMFDNDINNNAAAMVVEYWNGTAWTTLSVVDGTAVVTTSVGAAAFTGSGLDDATSAGTYTGSDPATFVVQIDATGTPDTFQWSKNGSVQATGVAITGAAQALSDGVTVSFGATTGHTLNDLWTIPIGETLGRTGRVTWNAPAGTSEFRQTLRGVTGYFYQVSVTGGSLADPTNIDLITAIPAQRWNSQQPILGYKFPFTFQGRVMLAARTEKNEGNRIDYGPVGKPDVYNGEDSSDQGKAIFIGDDQDLTAGIELSNRFAGTIQAMAVITKNTQTWILVGASPEDFQQFQISNIVGSPAPLTLVVADVSFAIDQQAVRNVAMWVSGKGPVLFDGGVIVPMRFSQPDGAISSIERYFDRNEMAYHITDGAFENARAWFDTEFGEYNVLLPTAGSTTCNVWVCCDMRRRKWFRKVPAAYPQMALPVIESDGEPHIYGGIDTGYMMHLENSNLWDDTDIAHILDTADILPSGSMWDETLVRYVKVGMARESGDADSLSILRAADGSGSFAEIATLAATGGTARWNKVTQALNLNSWSHQFRFSMSSNDKAIAPQLLGWAFLYEVTREELT